MSFTISYCIIASMRKKQKHPTKAEERKRLHIEVVRQMLTLATSGFGLVAALAWNEFVKQFVDGYIKVHLPEGSQIISLLLYAIIVTALAVLVTMQLSKILKNLELLEQRRAK